MDVSPADGVCSGVLLPPLRESLAAHSALKRAPGRRTLHPDAAQLSGLNTPPKKVKINYSWQLEALIAVDCC
jgi:hypothetical protein